MIGIGKKNDRISFNKITALFLVKEIQSKKIILKNIPRCHFSALRFAEFPRSQGKRVRISKNFLCHILSYHIFIVNILVTLHLELFWAKNNIILCFQFPCHFLLC